jgi:hypothetical protein
MLQFPHVEGRNEISDAPDDGKGRHPRDEEDRAAAVIPRRSETQADLDDSADELKPPGLRFSGRVKRPSMRDH